MNTVGRGKFPLTFGVINASETCTHKKNKKKRREIYGEMLVNQISA